MAEGDRGGQVVTIADVAAHAGVGAGTVSRVLNGSPKVRPATRARVLASIDELDYRPNRMARGLSRGRCQTIGVVVSFFTHASAVERLRGVVSALQDSAYDLVLLDVESPRHREEQIASLDRHRVDGVLVMSLPLSVEQIERLRRLDIAMAFVDTAAPGIPGVVSDDVAGGRLAAEHLLGLGHERIAFLGEPTNNPFGFVSSTHRESGFRTTLLAAGLEPDERLFCYAAHDREEAAAVAEPLLTRPDPPTAVFACSDVQALGVIETARRLGMWVPDDVSVVGYDDVEVSAYAGMTTIRQQLFESGRLGGELLLRALDDTGDELGGEQHVFQPELVVRSTSGPCPVDTNGTFDPAGGYERDRTMSVMPREVDR